MIYISHRTVWSSLYDFTSHTRLCGLLCMLLHLILDCVSSLYDLHLILDCMSSLHDLHLKLDCVYSLHDLHLILDCMSSLYDFTSRSRLCVFFA